jgi:UDP-N-acetylmuramoylalanine--D-glutamate ligase
MRRDLTNKKIAVLGFGAEGNASTEFLLSRGAEVFVFEQKEVARLDAEHQELAVDLTKRGAKFFFGDLESVDISALDLIVRSPGVPLTHPLLAASRKAGLEVTSGTALFFDECMAPIIGITGTKGKGTTSSLIYAMLCADKRPTHLVGNIGEPALGVLQDISAKEIVVYELSSFQLIEVTKSPYIAVVLMITQDHLDFHITISEYERAKANIVRFQEGKDMVVANMDYEMSRRIGESSLAKKYWISRRRPVAEGCFIEDGNIVLVRDGVKEVILPASEVALPGAHNLENACAAVMTAILVGVPIEAIQEVLRTFRGLPHRLQLVEEVQGIRYYDDSISTTPESAIAAIEAFDAPKILILGGSSKGADFGDLAKVIAASTSMRAIIGVGEEWPRIKEQLQAFKNDLVLIEGCNSMEEMVRSAKEVAKPGDVVLLSPACASFGMFKSYKDRGEQFVAAIKKI